MAEDGLKAPIKAQYLRTHPPPPAAAAPETVAFEAAPSKRAAGRARAKLRATGLCHAFARGACSRDACKFSHSAEELAASRLPDLPGCCPFLLSAAPCPFGPTCRFAGSHGQPPPPSVAAGEAVSDEPLSLPTPTEAPLPEANALGKELAGALRKGLHAFPVADARLKALGQKISFTTAEEVAVPEAKRARVDASVVGAEVRLRPGERKLIDFRGKVYVAPLTTVGNLPFRRLCKGLGADITCCEMALATALLQGVSSEWALLRRHPCEDVFGIQIAGGYPDALARTCELLGDAGVACDFVDVNMGCPIDLVCSKGAGAALMQKPARIEAIARACSAVLPCPLTLKMRTGFADTLDARVAHILAPQLPSWGVASLTLHGRSRAQRYCRTADWGYVAQVAAAARAVDLQVVGNGDVMSWQEQEAHVAAGVATCMLARGALVKPWLCTEVKERRDWDISSGERLGLLQTFARHGLEHWGSDAQGVATTRRFLLESLSFLHRYIPLGLLERLPQRLNQQPPAYVGRNDLETLMASPAAEDWVRLTTMLLGPPPPGWKFAPKHKSNAYASASEAGAAQYDAQHNG